jgi:adenosylcobyric acid synthase
MAKAIMIQGAGSNVGKSVVVAGLARAFANRGLAVRPFKPQNMSNNAAVTEDGGEIGRAQALQARACRAAPHTDMNPVLLKPETETGAQVVVQGQRLTTVRARDYARLKPSLMPAVLDSFHRLSESADLVLVEGAGSPAEINLREGDIANMGFAEAANVPVILIGDIDRGGVIAQLVGTNVVLDAPDRALIRGFMVNKFRGDVTLFEEGMRTIAERTGWQPLGVLPWFSDAAKLPAEDAADLPVVPARDGFRIAVPKLSRIANFDDLDPLKLEPGVSVQIVGPGQPLPGDADLILLPGTKSTIGDLAYMREQGWDIDLAAHVRRGGRVLGICGGYQMLGQTIEDPLGIEGVAGSHDGLGLLDVRTLMQPQKTLTQVRARHVGSDRAVSGYEIHIGQTHGPDCDNHWLTVEGQPHGAMSPDGRVMGCYLHGLFSEDSFRAHFLSAIGAESGGLEFDRTIDQTLDLLAAHLEEHLDLDAILAIAGSVGRSAVRA